MCGVARSWVGLARSIQQGPRGPRGRSLVRAVRDTAAAHASTHPRASDREAARGVDTAADLEALEMQWRERRNCTAAGTAAVRRARLGGQS